MGGNAFPNLKRMNREEYYSISKEVSDILINNKISHYVIKQIGEKKDFGDIDIIVPKHIKYVDIQRMFSPNNMKVNDNVYTFTYKDYQVDFISTVEQNLPTYKVFLDYNDLGNLIGRIAKRSYLKFKPTGLYYTHYNKDKSKKLKEFLLTNDVKTIFEFLDMSYERYTQGFQTYSETFHFVTSSKYFDSAYYKKGEYVNSRVYTRDLKRKTYVKFLEYIKDIPENNNVRMSKEDNITYIENYFEIPIKQEIEEINRKEQSYLNIVGKFNGHVVMQYTDYTEKKLGLFIRHFKEKYVYGNEHNFVDYAPEKIKELILNESKKFNDN